MSSVKLHLKVATNQNQDAHHLRQRESHLFINNENLFMLRFVFDMIVNSKDKHFLILRIEDQYVLLCFAFYPFSILTQDQRSFRDMTLILTQILIRKCDEEIIVPVAFTLSFIIHRHEQKSCVC